MITVLLLLIAAYLLGSIPSAVWIGRRFYGTDVREHGSRNAGATNTLRVLGLRAAIPVFALDVLKGVAAVALEWFSHYWTPHFENHTPQMYSLEIGLAAAAVLGHMFPLFASFRGGKGVSTLAGAVTAMHPLAVGICFAIFCIVLFIMHYVSLASITAGVCFPFVLVFMMHVHNMLMILFSVGIAVLLLWTHRKNIRRLLNSTENRIYIFKHHNHAGESY